MRAVRTRIPYSLCTVVGVDFAYSSFGASFVLPPCFVFFRPFFLWKLKEPTFQIRAKCEAHTRRSYTQVVFVETTRTLKLSKECALQVRGLEQLFAVVRQYTISEHIPCTHSMTFMKIVFIPVVDSGDACPGCPPFLCSEY